MGDQTSSTSVFWDSMFFFLIGVCLTFLYVRWVNWSTVFFNKNDIEKQQKLQANMLRPWRIWLMRIVGIIAMLFGAIGAWVGSGHSIPDFTG